MERNDKNKYISTTVNEFADPLRLHLNNQHEMSVADSFDVFSFDENYNSRHRPSTPEFAKLVNDETQEQGNNLDNSKILDNNPPQNLPCDLKSQDNSSNNNDKFFAFRNLMLKEKHSLPIRRISSSSTADTNVENKGILKLLRGKLSHGQRNTNVSAFEFPELKNKGKSTLIKSTNKNNSNLCSPPKQLSDPIAIIQREPKQNDDKNRNMLDFVFDDEANSCTNNGNSSVEDDIIAARLKFDELGRQKWHHNENLSFALKPIDNGRRKPEGLKDIVDRLNEKLYNSDINPNSTARSQLSIRKCNSSRFGDRQVQSNLPTNQQSETNNNKQLKAYLGLYKIATMVNKQIGKYFNTLSCPGSTNSRLRKSILRRIPLLKPQPSIKNKEQRQIIDNSNYGIMSSNTGNAEIER